jgi:hypothetical protein
MEGVYRDLHQAPESQREIPPHPNIMPTAVAFATLRNSESGSRTSLTKILGSVYSLFKNGFLVNVTN